MGTEGKLRDKFEDRIHDAALQETGLWTRVQCACRVRPLPARARKRIARRPLCCRGRSGTVRHWCPLLCPCAGAPAIYTQRVLRALASLVSGREMTSDAELLDGVAMVRVPAVLAEARRSAQRCAVFVWHVAQQARPTDTALTRTCAAQAMVLTGVCVFVIIMSGVKVVSSHGDRPWSFSRMRALARACASVAQSTGCAAAGHGQLSRITRSSARRVNLMRAPRRCMGGTRREPAYGGVCRSMPKSHGSSRCTACRTHASVPPRALAARGSSSVRSCP